MNEPRDRSSESELIEMIRAIDARAPERLHRRTRELIAERTRGGARGPARALRPRVASAAALVAVAAVVAVLLASLGGGSGALDLRSASALLLGPADRPAPAESVSRRTQLTAAVDGVAFPYWGERFGWRSTGAREGHLAGHSAMTVYYGDAAGRRVGYAIVAGTPAPRVSGGVVARRRGTAFRVTRADGSLVVTWLRRGHLCIVAGRGVSSATLLALASWQERGASAT
jgi:hypothetical protein